MLRVRAEFVVTVFCHGQLAVRFWHTQATNKTEGAGAMAVLAATTLAQVQGSMHMSCFSCAAFFVCSLLWLVQAC